MLEIDLNPGDLLYLPRDYIHTTNTSETHSAHSTIGIAVYTWLDLAGELLQSAMGSRQFRKALPPGFASRSDAKPKLMADLTRVLDELRESAHRDEPIDLFLSRVRSANTPDRRAFGSDVVVIDSNTPLQAPGSNHFRIASLGSKIAVEFKQRRFILPAETQSALEGMRQHRVFKTADLPGTLSLDAKLTLIRTLFENVFLSTPS